MGSEMQGGCDGGWHVFSTDDQFFMGENVDELLGYIDDHCVPLDDEDRPPVLARSEGQEARA